MRNIWKARYTLLGIVIKWTVILFCSVRNYVGRITYFVYSFIFKLLPTFKMAAFRIFKINFLNFLLVVWRTIVDDFEREQQVNCIHYSVQTLLSYRHLPKNLKIKIYKTVILPVGLYGWSMVSYIEGGTQTKDIWKQDPEANFLTQEGWEWRMKKVLQWETS